MQANLASRQLDAWEEGQAQHPLQRALTLLRLAEPEQSMDALAALHIGERDRRLLALRRRLFGSAFEAVTPCPQCSERLELSFLADQLPHGSTGSPGPTGEATLAWRGGTVTARLPNTLDLLEAAAHPDRRIELLLQRCAGQEISSDLCGPLQEAMVAADPMAHVEMALECPHCGHTWAAVFDIASYLWAELSRRAMRWLREIHTLAAAYGWSEAEILALPPRRREAYLDLVAGA
jgi:hypothetical protein